MNAEKVASQLSAGNGQLCTPDELAVGVTGYNGLNACLLNSRDGGVALVERSAKKFVDPQVFTRDGGAADQVSAPFNLVTDADDVDA